MHFSYEVHLQEYNPSRHYKLSRAATPIKRALTVIETYEMFELEFKKRNMEINVTDYKWSELQEMLKEYDKYIANAAKLTATVIT